MGLGVTLVPLLMSKQSKYGPRKRGDAHPSKLLLFWGYNSNFIANEWWIPIEAYAPRLEKLLARNRRYAQDYRQKNPDKTQAYLLEWRKVNRDHVLSTARARAAQWNIENPQKAKAAKQKWARENKDRKNELGRAEYIRNKVQKSIYGKAYAKKFPEKRNVSTALRRARLKGAAHERHDILIEETLRATARRLEGILGVKFEIDHIIPIVRGGWHHHANLMILPRTWNRRKSSLGIEILPDAWRPCEDKLRWLTFLGIRAEI